MYRRLRTLRAREVRGCTAAFDASRAGTMFDATSGGSPVAPDGQVARWESDAAGAHHATQATAGNRPIYRRRGLNGAPCLDSTGASTCNLQTASYYPSAGNAAVSSITVARAEDTLLASSAWQYGQNTTGRRWELAFQYTFGRSAVDISGSYVGRNVAPESSAPSVCTVTRPADVQLQATATRWLGHTITYDFTAGGGNMPNTGTGVPLRLMSEATGTWRIRQLALVAFYDRELSRAALMRLEQSAMRKWRLASART